MKREILEAASFFVTMIRDVVIDVEGADVVLEVHMIDLEDVPGGVEEAVDFFPIRGFPVTFVAAMLNGELNVEPGSASKGLCDLSGKQSRGMHQRGRRNGIRGVFGVRF